MSRRRDTEARLRRLSERPLPDEGDARERGWAMISAAYAGRPPVRSSRPRALRPLALAAAIAVLALAAAALTPAGARVGEWIEQRFSAGPEKATPAFAGLPGGRVLSVARRDAWVVHPDGSLRNVGAFSEAGWSPRGKFVIGVRGRRLVAVTPAGALRWSVTRPRRVHHPAWSGGEGFRVAYLEGRTLRAVAGDGSGDHLVRRAAAAVTPAWRPGPAWVLSYAGAGGLIETVEADSERRLWARRTGGRPLQLAWSRDGRRLVALFAGGLRVYDRRGRPLLSRKLKRAQSLALHPSGRRAAVTVGGTRATRVLAVPLGSREAAPRSLFDGFGRVDGLAWSPDGRRLLLAWRDADQWLLLGPRRRVRALSQVSSEIGAGAGFPRVAGWCCPR